MRLNAVSNCPVCDGQAMIMDSVRTIHPDVLDQVELRNCVECGHWWHSPVPDQETLSGLYEAASRYVVGPGARESYSSPKREQSFQRFVRTRLTSSLIHERYLEVGAGGGHLLRFFRSQGFDCYGVDPGRWVPDKAIYSSLKSLPRELSFGVFVLQDVLEHVVDPRSLLEHLRTIATENAVLFASFPSCESRPARRFKGAWNMIRPYGHLHYFSGESAKRLFRSARWCIRAAALSRHQSFLDLLALRQWRAVVYECLKGGKDQLYVQAIA